MNKMKTFGVYFKLFNSTMFSEDAEIIACRSREGCHGCRAKVTWPTQNFIVATSSSLRAQYNILPRPLKSGPPQKLMTEYCPTTVFPFSLIILACRLHLKRSAKFVLHKGNRLLDNIGLPGLLTEADLDDGPRNNSSIASQENQRQVPVASTVESLVNAGKPRQHPRKHGMLC